MEAGGIKTVGWLSLRENKRGNRTVWWTIFNSWACSWHFIGLEQRRWRLSQALYRRHSLSSSHLHQNKTGFTCNRWFWFIQCVRFFNVSVRNLLRFFSRYFVHSTSKHVGLQERETVPPSMLTQRFSAAYTSSRPEQKFNCWRLYLQNQEKAPTLSSTLFLFNNLATFP